MLRHHVKLGSCPIDCDQTCNSNLPKSIAIATMARGKTYIVEHLDPELGPWSELEYQAIAEETDFAGGQFCLSSLPPAFKVPTALQAVPNFFAEMRSVEDLYQGEAKKRVCLLDPAADRDLSPEDGALFDVFLFGGILGKLPGRDQKPRTDRSIDGLLMRKTARR
jgi:ribosome biogenesis SPOUT family RNA methylase Rps3